MKLFWPKLTLVLPIGFRQFTHRPLPWAWVRLRFVNNFEASMPLVSQLWKPQTLIFILLSI